MKRHSLQHYRTRAMIEDALIVIGPPILMFIGILWFFKEDWLHSNGAKALMSFADSFLALLTSAVLEHS